MIQLAGLDLPRDAESHRFPDCEFVWDNLERANKCELEGQGESFRNEIHMQILT